MIKSGIHTWSSSINIASLFVTLPQLFIIVVSVAPWKKNKKKGLKNEVELDIGSGGWSWRLDSIDIVSINCTDVSLDN